MHGIGRDGSQYFSFSYISSSALEISHSLWFLSYSTERDIADREMRQADTWPGLVRNEATSPHI